MIHLELFGVAKSKFFIKKALKITWQPGYPAINVIFGNFYQSAPENDKTCRQEGLKTVEDEYEVRKDQGVTWLRHHLWELFSYPP